MVALFLYCCLLFVLQQVAVDVGERYKLPIINSIIIRVIPIESYRLWFAENGMPLAAALNDKYPQLDSESRADRQRIYRLYRDTVNYGEFLDWVVRDGRAVYARFLLTHWGYTLLWNETEDKRGRIFAYNLEYAKEPRGYSVFFERVFPMFNVWASAALCVAVLVANWRQLSPVALLPCNLGLVCVAHAFISYNADALEVERHLLITNILIQMLGLVSSALLIDFILNSQAKLQPLREFKRLSQLALRKLMRRVPG